jgi:hypothetical protein
MPTVGVSASPWIWAKTRIKPAALIRQCGDGVVSNVARMGSFCKDQIHPFFLHIHKTGPFLLTTALRMPTIGVPALPWIWAKARIEPAALIRQCRDGVVSNVARMGSFCMEIHPFCTYIEQDRSDSPPHSGCPQLVFPLCHGYGRRPESNQLH